jgi:hypothetical protein
MYNRAENGLDDASSSIDIESVTGSAVYEDAYQSIALRSQVP